MTTNHTVNGYPLVCRVGQGGPAFELLDPKTDDTIFATHDAAECLDVTHVLGVVSDLVGKISEPEAAADLIVTTLRDVMASRTAKPDATAPPAK